MRELPGGLLSDLTVLGHRGAVLEQCDGYVVVRTPDEPTFHWGNFLVVTDPERVDDVQHWLQTFARALPEAEHRAIALPAAPSPGVWEAEGLSVEHDTVLETTTCPPTRPAPASYDVRALAGDADWAADVALAVADNDRTGDQEPASYLAYSTEHAASDRRLSEAGVARFFGAFDGDHLVSRLGIVACGDYARYQSVLTHPDHRAQGLAGHLLGVAAQWAAQQDCTRWVIVTGADNPAGRLYRSLGFTLAEPAYSAYRKA